MSSDVYANVSGRLFKSIQKAMLCSEQLGRITGMLYSYRHHQKKRTPVR
jgi:hypothetical protein